MKGDKGFLIRPDGQKVETVTVYDPLDHMEPKRRVPTGQRFAMLTPERRKLLARTSGAAWAIYSYLLEINWKNLRKPVKLTNEVLTEIGVSRFAKSRALQQLERRKLVKVKRAGHQAPTVTPLK
jgi:hypothetical protein